MFLVDTGLLSAMGDIDSRTLLEGNAIFTEFKGALTEQYVFQQLDGLNDYVIYYWSAERSTAEVDSLIQYNDRFIPVEVKAEENLQSKKLKSFQGEIQSGIFFTPIYVRFPEARPAYESAALCNHFDGKSLTTEMVNVSFNYIPVIHINYSNRNMCECCIFGLYI